MHPITQMPPVETWQVRKPVATSAGGVVASQHHLASDIGAKVLAEGGNAVDAAVTAGLAIGAVEPWMSGLGGCGFMLVHIARTKQTFCVDFGVRAPLGLDPADYPLAGGGADDDLFAWPAVKDERNVQGPLSIAVPGMVAGHAAALERFGTRSWAEALGPAISLAEREIAVDWYATLKITAEAKALARDAECAKVFLPGGLPPSGTWGGPLPKIRLGRLATTLKRLAEAGPQDFYTGAIAADLAGDLAAAGNAITAEDLAAYRATIGPAMEIAMRGGQVGAAPGLTAGPTLAHCLALAGGAPMSAPGSAGGPDGAAYAAYANALASAYDHRLRTLGDEGETAGAPSSTTHLSVVDGQGNIVALTQTLLSVFGSRVMLPSTGILMNNGIMWFDPRPGRPNAILPGRKPLSNMCPAMLGLPDGRMIGLGASGGRRILPAVFQLISFLADHGLGLEDAVHLPRIDMSGGAEVIADPRLGRAVHERLAADRPVTVVPNAVYPALYACPNVVAYDPRTRMCEGAAYVMSPWAKASCA